MTPSTATRAAPAERFPAHLFATEADYLAAYFAAPDDEAEAKPDTRASIDECKRRAAVYWSPDVASQRRMVRAVEIREAFGE